MSVFVAGAGLAAPQRVGRPGCHRPAAAVNHDDRVEDYGVGDDAGTGGAAAGSRDGACEMGAGDCVATGPTGASVEVFDVDETDVNDATLIFPVPATGREAHT